MKRTFFQIVLMLILIFTSVSIYSEVYLGVYLTEYDYKKENNKKLPEYGLIIHHVIKDSPAEDAKLKEGDLILEVEKQKLTNIDRLAELLKDYKTGDAILIKYFRNNEIHKTKLILADKVEPDLPNIESRIEDLIDRSKTFIFRIESQDDNVIGVEISPTNMAGGGVVITNILPNSPAQKAKLQVGDVIIRIEGEDIRNSVDVINAIQTAEVGKKIKIEFYRKSRKISTQVEVVKRKSIFKP